MDLSVVNNVSNNAYYTKKSNVTATSKEETSKSGFSSEAAVYEKSDSAVTNLQNNKTDRSAIVSQLKADLETQKSQLLDIVRKTITGQGNAIANADDMWKFLASGDFTVDAETKANAQAAIAEDGYWGVNQTSDRILDFAIALSGNDSSKAEELIDAFKKGFSEATAAWGKELPDISQKTYDAVLEKFDAWKNGTYGQDS
ncbi:MAG: hypothetical protein K5644_00770 [Lachnospiraceae bacterium]|nr:hypothetical protein [Lachnospiraceae bacterium]